MKTKFLLLALSILTFTSNLSATTLFSRGAAWRFRNGLQEASTPVGAWRLDGFDDAAFTNAPAPFWYGDVLPGGTQLTGMQNSFTCFFLRQTFVLSNVSEVTVLRLGALVDDGFVAWINGTEVQRVNMNEPAGSPVSTSTLAANATEPVAFTFYTLPPPTNYLVNGTNVIAIQVFNTSSGSSDIGFDTSLEFTRTETNPPLVVAISPSAGQVSSLASIAVEFSEPVTGVDAADLLINGAPASSMASNGTTYTFNFTQPAFGPVQVNWAASHNIRDQALVPNAFDTSGPGSGWQYSLVDDVPPTVLNISPLAGGNVRSLASVTVLFSEAVAGVDATDLLINNLPATNVVAAGVNQYRFQFPPPATGAVQVAWSSGHGIEDLAAVPNAFAGGAWSYTLDPFAAEALPFINEFMAANTRTLLDDFGQYSDWIEIYNPGSEPLNLDGWYLTDNANNLTKWRFPATNLPPAGFLVVFASERNRAVPGARLHTNFRLAADGEYLALVKPDGVTIASQFSPFYPPQVLDVAYGFPLLTGDTTLVATGAQARILVPTAANGGSTLNYNWTGSTNEHVFNDGAWPSGPTGAGFSTGSSLVDPASLMLRFNFTAAPAANVIPDSKPSGTPHDGLNAGASWVDASTDTAPTPITRHGAMQFNAAESDQITLAAHTDFNATRGTICFWMRSAGTTGGGSEGAMLFDRRTSTGDVIVQANDGRIFVQASGGATVNSFYSTATVSDNRWHHVAYVYDQTSGGGITIYIDGVARGSQANSGAWSWPAAQQIELGRSHDGYWRLYNGLLDDLRIYNRQLNEGEVALLYAGDDGVAPADIGTDLQADMWHTNASAFLRIPFVVNNPDAISLLTLRLKYDDGYIAWINGQEVSRANAPEAATWNSAATAPHSSSMAESIRINNEPGLLRAGTNLLAIQGLNVHATNGSFLILPELTATTIAAMGSNAVYFTQPTPGSENTGGASAPGPAILEVAHTPNVPLDAEDLVVTARVTPTFSPVADVLLRYRIMFGPEVAVPMNDSGSNGDAVAGDGTWSAIIPASASTNGQMIRYFVTANDDAAHATRWPLFTDPADSAEYLGTIVNPTNVTSKLAIVHLFVDPSQQSAVDGKPGGRAAVFYDGELYDNILMRLRGNSTSGYFKKSHRLEFNREHPFRHNGPGGRIRKTSFTADYPDPAYMRQGLTFWLCDLMGAPAPFYIPTRLQMNGAFYQLANHNDVHGEELLERLGYDPNGALYNAVGTATPDKFSTGGFEKKTRRWDTSDADYLQLANAISETLPAGQRATNLFELFDVPEVINYLVVARFAHENDDVWANMSLYHDNDGDNLWRAVPFDMNLTWGAMFYEGGDYTGIQAVDDNHKSHPLYGSSQALAATSGNWNRVYDIFFQVPRAREMVLRRMRTLLDTYIGAIGTPTNATVIEQRVLAWRDLITEEATRDRAKWGWPGKGGQSNFDPGIDLTNGVRQLLENFFIPRRQHFLGKHCVTNTALPLGITKAHNAGIPTSQPLNAYAAILGVEFNPASRQQDQEWILLTNPAPFAVDISGWQLEGGVNFTFSPGTVIPSNSACYVSPNVRSFRARTTGPRGGQGLFVLGPYQGQLSARGETLRMRNTTGQIVNTHAYAGAPSLAQQFLRITEIMYHPDAADEAEFIELRNLSPNQALDLAGVRLSNGVEFNFAGSTVTNLAPGERVLVVKNLTEFQIRHGLGLNVAGQYTNSLDNGGERIQLLDASNEEILDFSYSDTWHPITDGLGFSLVVVDEMAAPDAWGNRSQWRPSGSLGGSPGTNDPAAPNLEPVIITEALTRSETPGTLDAIELHNPTTNEASVAGWYLSDDFSTPQKYRIPDGTVVPGGGFLVFDEMDFNAGGAGFALGADGDEVWLFSADASGHLTGYFHGFSFGAADSGVTFGRHVTSQGAEHFVAQAASTLGTNNAGPLVGPVVIGELMYHPPDLGTNDNSADEFVELVNLTAQPVSLFETNSLTNTWKLAGGISFSFPTNITLSAGETVLVMNFNPTDAAALASFRAKYGVDDTVRVFGPYGGKLNNETDDVELQKPTLLLGASLAWVSVDKVEYTDTAPWAVAADGYGFSLQRHPVSAYGNDPLPWLAALPSAGVPFLAGGSLPVITQQPADVIVSEGTNALFSVTAQGSDPLLYQWRFQGTNLPGATNSMLFLPAVSARDAGPYEVIVVNAAGATVSAAAHLSVLSLPMILLQPDGASVRVRPDPAALPTTNVTLRALAYSPFRLSYQWLLNGTNLPAATNATLTVVDVQPDDWGYYSVAISDPSGAVISAPALLNPLVTPTWVFPPASQRVVVNGTVTLSAECTGSPPPFIFEWRRGATLILTVTNQEPRTFFTVTAPASAGSPSQIYRVGVRNAATSITLYNSTLATLTWLADTDADGMPDIWESAFGFSPSNSADANLDFDNDGLANWMEYRTDTVPTNAASALELEIQPGGHPSLLFHARSNLTYSVLASDNPASTQWVRIADIIARKTNFSGTLPVSPTATRSFYRLTTPRIP